MSRHFFIQDNIYNMGGLIVNLGKLDEKCPKCGCKDKTLKRDIEPEHYARAKTGALLCSECGYVFKSRKDEEKEDEN
jgi:Cys-rich peptide (TIGR04165 family)